MLDKVREETMLAMHRVQVEVEQAEPLVEEPPESTPVNYNIGVEEEQETQQTYKREQPKVGRNDPCPCGSGKKYKQCHGKKR